MEKKNSYSEIWLHQDMENMGYIFEYCDEYCKKLFNTDIDKEKLLSAFMASNFRHEMETGHERLLSQSAYDSIKMFINIDCKGDINQFKKKDSGEEKEYYCNQLYWVGWMYAYLHYKEDISSKDLFNILPLETMLEHYYLGHEIDKDVYYKKIKHLFE